MIEFSDAEIKEDLWAWNDFQDRLWEEEKRGKPESEPQGLSNILEISE